jgi:hypothetical protein
MNSIREDGAEAADYDDAPGHPSGHPLIRIARAAGALATVGVGIAIIAALALRIDVDVDVEFYLAGLAVSLASVPLIMVFWSQEVAWRGGWWSATGSIVVVSILTWTAEVLFSAILLIAVLNIFR